MIRECFRNKITCEFAIITNDLDTQTISHELNIAPHRYFNKGDSITSENSLRVGNKPYGLWAIASRVTIDEEINLLKHLKYFKKLLSNKLDIIKMLQNKYGLECIFSISIETEDAGIGFDLNELDLSFINKISNRLSLTFIAKEAVNK
jgi:hypothetical protein